MQRTLWIVLSVVFVVVLLSFTVTYTVRFTEKAVLTTFGEAAKGTAIKDDPGLHFKLPYPIQAVTTYDTRLRFTQSRSQTQLTKDERQIVVEAYCNWHVSDPLKFYQRFSNAGASSDDHFRKADDAIKSALSSAMSEMGKYRMDELFNRDPKASRLEELEKVVLATLSKGSESGLSLGDYGIEAKDVGISKIILPQNTSQAVNERLVANRKRIADEITSKASASETAIKSKADSDAKTIEAFAERYAQEIRTKGDRDAAPFIRDMNVNAELAVFLKNMDMLREAVTKQATLVVPFSAGGMGGLNPNYLDGLKKGGIPSSGLPADWFDKVSSASNPEGSK